MKLWALGLALVLTLSGINAEAAKRFGGGKSIGQQSSNVTKQAPAAAPGSPMNAAPAAKPAPAPAPTPAGAPKRPWGAMLGGLAAGLGWLGWRTHSGWGKHLATS
jgi:predicted lipid-binding transport protein (Tim44 family)